MYKQQWLTVKIHVYTCTHFHGTILIFSVRMDLIIIMEMSYEGWKHMEAVLY